MKGVISVWKQLHRWSKVMREPEVLHEFLKTKAFSNFSFFTPSVLHEDAPSTSVRLFLHEVLQKIFLEQFCKEHTRPGS